MGERTYDCGEQLDCTCANGGSVCDEQCIDHDIDRRHCGGCYEPCPEGQRCAAGYCEADD